MKIVGHRGARGLAPENSIASLKKALEHHVDEIECDARVTKDGIVILHHDKDVSTPTGPKLRISRHTYAELKKHDSDLATLKEALAAVPESTPLQIEIKPREDIQSIIKTINAELGRGRESSSLLIGSKSQSILRQTHQAFPEVQKVVIEAWSGVRAIHRAHQVNTKRLSMNKLWIWRGFIRPMSKRGWLLYAYTVNNPVKAKKWGRYGLSGIFTDYPDQFKK